MELKTLLLQEATSAWTVTLNRPDRRNAMSLEMVGELCAVLGRAEAEVSCRALVLRGAGGHFCSGGDVADMLAAKSKEGAPDDAIAEVSRQFGRMCVAFGKSRLAVVVQLEGAVMGGGFGLACVADVSLAAASAVFRLPETSLGLIPAQIAPFLLERLGYSQAKRLGVTGGSIDSTEALRIGLIHQLFSSPEALEAGVEATLQQILACAPHALAATKALLARAREERTDALVDDAGAIFAQAFRGPEGQAGMRALLEKRPPPWAPGG